MESSLRILGVRDGGDNWKFPRLHSLQGNDSEKGIWPSVRARQLDLHPGLNPAGDMAMMK